MILQLMMQGLRKLENEASTTRKMEIIREYTYTMESFTEMLVYALDPYTKFGIQQLPTQTVVMPPREPATWDDIKAFLNMASAMRGDKVIQEFNSLSSRLSFEERMLLTRVVLKDLRCGVGATLVNKVIPGLIPSFGVMLAEELLERHIPHRLTVGDSVFVQPKLNGDRVVVICPPMGQGQTEVFSRNGIQLLNYNKIAHNLRLLTLSSAWADTGLVFDGEVILGDFFKTRSVKKKAGNEAEGAVFNLFDTIKLNEWKSGNTARFASRHAMSLKLSQSSTFTTSPENLKLVPTWKLKPHQITWEFLLKLRDALIAAGYEGLIGRPNVSYNQTTRSSLFKLKKMKSMDCLIEEVLLGDEGHKHDHHAGRVLVRLDDGETLCKAGLKLKDPERDEMWKNRALYAGKMCEIHYQDMTRNANGAPKLQFPVYYRLREDKS